MMFRSKRIQIVVCVGDVGEKGDKFPVEYCVCGLIFAEESFAKEGEFVMLGAQALHNCKVKARGSHVRSSSALHFLDQQENTAKKRVVFLLGRFREA